MIVLVTGASGFLGGRLVELLVDQLQDAELRITVRPQSSLSHLQHLVSSKRVHVFCIQSLEDEQGLAKALKDVNYIFHCAAASSYVACVDLELCCCTNDMEVIGQLMLILRLPM